jgi:hypothetical protein
MRKTLIVSALALLGLMAAVSAQAAGGCGGGFHRGPYGGCVRNGVVVGAPVVGAPVVAAPVVAAPVVVGRPVYRRRCVWRAGVRVCA